jgi:hypothetical protein
MSSETFACPECKSSLRYSANLKPGDEVRCPKCQAQFRVPESALSPPDAAPRSTEEYTDKPGARRPRFSEPAADEISSTRRPARYGAAREDFPEEDDPDRPFTGAYSIDINRWFGVAGKHYSAILGSTIGFFFVAGIIAGIPELIVLVGPQFLGQQVAPNEPVLQLVVSQVLMQLGMLVVVPLLVFPLTSGTSAVCLAQLKGRPWTFSDFFAGFQRFGALAGVGFAAQLLGLAISLPQTVIALLAMQSHAPQLMLLSPLVTLVGLVLFFAVQVRLFLFAPTIIFDRNLGAMDTMKRNWELTSGHFWGLFGVSLLLGLINVGGALACGIGLLFTMPYTILILNAGYLLIRVQLISQRGFYAASVKGNG